tara:strand:+ start:2523 stop:4376 length:1854 start_codon:yes stop_codon:yes gene_type:complete
MPLTKIKFAPGVNKEGTEYSADAGWFSADKIRFRQGRPEKIGGWVKYSETSFLGICRSIHDWASLESIRYIGLGTNLKFYVVEGNSFNDITPIRSTTSAGDVTFAATNGSSTITATDTSHGAVVNDFVTFSSAASLGGNITAAVLNQEYQITAVPTVNTYEFTAKDTSGATVTANSSDTGNGGSSTVGAYQINTGLNNFLEGTGWGAGSWGMSAWGSASSISAAGQLRLFSQDNFGEDLLFNARGGGIFFWDESSGTGSRAVNITSLSGSNQPTIALQVMVSDIDQHVIAFGVNPIGSSAIDPLFIRFSDQENATDWTPTAINTAGGIRINSGSEIIGAVQGRQEILVFTDVSLHSMRFVGAPFTFQIQTVSTDISMISPKAAVNARGSVYFMDKGGFYVYNGSVQPLPCSVKEFVFSNINLGQAFKVFAAENNAFSEVMWFYPIGEGNTEITNYVSYNYAEDLWSVGTLDRGAWQGVGTQNFPMATSVNNDTSTANYLYYHENGFDDDGSAMTAFVESGDLELQEGERFMMVSRIIPDFAFSGATSDASISMTMKGSDFPLETPTTLSTSTITNSSTQSFIRARSRHQIVRVESSGLGYGWRLGDLRFDIRPDGRR